ncbi:MAG: proteasome subunit beta [archaeon]|nr:proteasome subunit beta [archaeon]
MYWDKVKKDSGFDFSLCERNEALQKSNKKGLNLKFKKTGTTIVGCIYKDGVILGADTRATEGPIVADPDCVKIHYLAPNMYCCGAGTAADNEMVTQMMSSELELHRLYTGRESRIAHAEARLCQHLFRYQGHVGAHLIIGGVDCKGPQLVTISAYGNSFRGPYTTMGSGSLNAMAILETRYKDGMTKEEAIELVKSAIEAGIFNDLGSGSNVDVYNITRNGCEKYESYRCYNKKEFSQSDSYVFPKGTTEIIEETQKKWRQVEVVDESAPMDIC